MESRRDDVENYSLTWQYMNRFATQEEDLVIESEHEIPGYLDMSAGPEQIQKGSKYSSIFKLNNRVLIY